MIGGGDPDNFGQEILLEVLVDAKVGPYLLWLLWWLCRHIGVT
jgi:hypothetical protein